MVGVASWRKCQMVKEQVFAAADIGGFKVCRDVGEMK